MQPCPEGFYCPNSSSILPCPKGSFCKAYTLLPKRCPWLAKCRTGSGSADLSLGGFLGLLLILLVLWLGYVGFSAYIRSDPPAGLSSAPSPLPRGFGILAGSVKETLILTFSAISQSERNTPLEKSITLPAYTGCICNRRLATSPFPTTFLCPPPPPPPTFVISPL